MTLETIAIEAGFDNVEDYLDYADYIEKEDAKEEAYRS